MPTDDKAQLEAAKRLRARIEQLKHPKPETTNQDESKTPPKSIREAIQDRMKEIDGKPHV
jgi:hypothetical protein